MAQLATGACPATGPLLLRLVRAQPPGSPVAPLPGPVPHLGLGGDAAADHGQDRHPLLRELPPARFPSLQALAEEPEDEVLAAWSGLGYYHRARNLHRGAQHVAERHGGRFPDTLEAALAVPGVGLYTASAVLSIAYETPLPVVDGNVRRVLARLFALSGPQFRREGAVLQRRRGAPRPRPSRETGTRR